MNSFSETSSMPEVMQRTALLHKKVLHYKTISKYFVVRKIVSQCNPQGQDILFSSCDYRPTTKSCRATSGCLHSVCSRKTPETSDTNFILNWLIARDFSNFIIFHTDFHYDGNVQFMRVWEFVFSFSLYMEGWSQNTQNEAMYMRKLICFSSYSAILHQTVQLFRRNIPSPSPEPKIQFLWNVGIFSPEKQHRHSHWRENFKPQH